MSRFLVSFLVAASLSACAPARIDRDIEAGDLMFGRFPASETILRVKAPCLFTVSRASPPTALNPSGSRSDDTEWFIPIGDYVSSSADSNGIFYSGPDEAIVPAEYLRPGRGGPLMALGIYFPFEVGPRSSPLQWVNAVSMEWGTSRRVKRGALPERCWQPYGTTMAIMHKGTEVPLR